MSEQAKTAGMCHLCANRIYVGDDIQTWEVSGVMTASHQKCVDENMRCGSAPVEAPAPAQPTKHTVMLVGSVPPGLRKYLAEAQTLDLPAQPTPAEPSARTRLGMCSKCGWFQCICAVAPASEPSSQPLCRCPEGVCLIHRNSSPDNCGFKHHTTAPAAEAENVALREREAAKDAHCRSELSRIGVESDEQGVLVNREVVALRERVKELADYRIGVGKQKDALEAAERQLELCRDTLSEIHSSGISEAAIRDRLRKLLTALQPKAASPDVREEKLNG